MDKDPNLYKSVKVAAAPLARARVYSAQSGIRLQRIISDALWDYLRRKGAAGDSRATAGGV